MPNCKLSRPAERTSSRAPMARNAVTSRSAIWPPSPASPWSAIWWPIPTVSSVSTDPAAMQLLFIITSDPRHSPRPAEAIRIAAGVGVWKRTGLTVYLRNAAVLALSEDTAGLLDEENYRRH